jgi:DNA-binding PadR family transcriptional regulator
MTTTVAKVLRIFLEDPTEPQYGFDLMQTAGLPSGTLYPILARLEHAGWISGKREVIDPSAAGRPARRMYTLTAEGATVARRELASLSAQLRPPVVRRVMRPGESPA